MHLSVPRFSSYFSLSDRLASGSPHIFKRPDDCGKILAPGMRLDQLIPGKGTPQVNQSCDIVAGTQQKNIRCDQSRYDITRFDGRKEDQHNRDTGEEEGKRDHHTENGSGGPDDMACTVQKREGNMENSTAAARTKKQDGKTTPTNPYLQQTAPPPKPEHIEKKVEAGSVKKNIGYKSPGLGDCRLEGWIES